MIQGATGYGQPMMTGMIPNQVGMPPVQVQTVPAPQPGQPQAGPVPQQVAQPQVTQQANPTDDLSNKIRRAYASFENNLKVEKNSDERKRERENDSDYKSYFCECFKSFLGDYSAVLQMDEARLK